MTKQQNDLPSCERSFSPTPRRTRLAVSLFKKVSPPPIFDKIQHAVNRARDAWPKLNSTQEKDSRTFDQIVTEQRKQIASSRQFLEALLPTAQSLGSNTVDLRRHNVEGFDLPTVKRVVLEQAEMFELRRYEPIGYSLPILTETVQALFADS